MKTITLLVDCDGVWLGRTRERNGYNNRHDYATLLMTLENISQKRKYRLITLTDRGGAQLPTLAYIFQGDRFQGGESGAVVYDNHSHSIISNPRFEKAIKKIEIVRRDFLNKFGEYFPLEPGVYSSIRVERVDNTDLTEPENFLSEVARKSDGLFSFADHGDCLCLKPSQINKRIGIEWLCNLYEQANAPIDLSNSIWIGDGNSDIPAADFVRRNGGKIGGVSNSQENYKNFILEKGGYLAKESHTAGMVEIIKHYCG